MVIFVAGLVGVGKSAIARPLSRQAVRFITMLSMASRRVIYPQDPDFERNIRNGIPFQGRNAPEGLSEGRHRFLPT